MSGGLDLFGQVQQGLFEVGVQPVLFKLGLAGYLEEAYDGVGWFMVGVLQIIILLCVIGPLQRWRPVEPVRDARAVRVDIIYTLLHRLGLVRLLLFFTLTPLADALFGWLHLHGVSGWQLDQWVGAWWPGVTDQAWVGFLAYLIVFDGFEYVIHRAQHHFNWWWALHAVHHSQRQMTMWTDDRTHLLDDLIHDSLFALLALWLGVAPGQFVALVALSQLLQSLAHANVRLSFGPVGERLLVSPRYHRVHHAIGIGHESAGPGTLGGANFAILFPVWDIIFGTANFSPQWPATGIRDQLSEAGGRNYGRGFWAQQWLGLLRLLRVSGA